MPRAASARAVAARMDGRAKRSAFPGFIEPSFATLGNEPPDGGEWFHEVKFDGYRAQAHLRDGDVRIFTRRGYDWSDPFKSLVKALKTLPIKEAIFDGEIVVPDERGVADFHKLQGDLARGRSDRLLYEAFDLLYLDGHDLRPLPLRERKQMLAEVLKNAPRAIQYSDHFVAEVWMYLCRHAR